MYSLTPCLLLRRLAAALPSPAVQQPSALLTSTPLTKLHEPEQ